MANNQEDVAIRSDGEMIRVDSVGRRPMQKVWMWNTTTTLPEYDPAKDGPRVRGECPVQPAEAELVQGEKTREYLEVGLVFGEEPDMFISKPPRDKERENEQRAARGILNRTSTIMRVFVPVTEYLVDHTGFFVGCRPHAGRLHPRAISTSLVFVYPEFFQGADKSQNLEQQWSHVMKACKEYASVNKGEPPAAIAHVTYDEVVANLNSVMLRTTLDNDLATKCSLCRSMFENDQSIERVQQLIEILDKAHPDLKYGPETSTKGICAFMDFDQELSKELAQMFLEDMKDAFPKKDGHKIDVTLVMMVHAVLCREDEPASEFRHCHTVKLGKRLPWARIAFFIHRCHDEIQPRPNGTYDPVQVAMMVNIMLRTVEELGHYCPPPWVPPNRHSELTQDDFRHILSELQSVLGKLVDMGDASLDQHLMTVHGALHNQTSIQSMVNHAANAVDKTELEYRLHQIVLAWHGVVLINEKEISQALRGVLEFVEDILKLLGK